MSSLTAPDASPLRTTNKPYSSCSSAVLLDFPHAAAQHPARDDVHYGQLRGTTHTQAYKGINAVG
eukprot:8762764-Pyramimonas_sp.AAC.1